MSIIVSPRDRLTRAAFDLREANQNLEEAERRFAEALHAVELEENQQLPTAAEMRGIFKREG